MFFNSQDSLQLIVIIDHIFNAIKYNSYLPVIMLYGMISVHLDDCRELLFILCIALALESSIKNINYRVSHLPLNDRIIISFFIYVIFSLCCYIENQCIVRYFKTLESAHYDPFLGNAAFAKFLASFNVLVICSCGWTHGLMLVLVNCDIQFIQKYRTYRQLLLGW